LEQLRQIAATEQRYRGDDTSDRDSRDRDDSGAADANAAPPPDVARPLPGRWRRAVVGTVYEAGQPIVTAVIACETVNASAT
jgi:hypothetical protein